MALLILPRDGAPLSAPGSLVTCFFSLMHGSLCALKLTCEPALRIGISPTLTAWLPSSINALFFPQKACRLLFIFLLLCQSLDPSGFLKDHWVAFYQK